MTRIFQSLSSKLFPTAVQETLLHLLLACVISISVMAIPLGILEAPLYDLRQWLSFKPPVDPRIAIITIDDQTLSQLNELSPLPLHHHRKAAEELARHNVKGVGYLVDFTRVARLDSKGFQSETLQEFYRSTVKLNASGTPFVLGIPHDGTAEVPAPAPLSQIPQSVAIVHRDATQFGKDKVTRRALLSIYDKPALELALINRIFANETISNPPGTYRAKETDSQYFLFPLHQNEGVIYDPAYETFSYPRYSFADLVEGRIPEGTLKDKIVLVGTFQRDNPADFTLISSLSRFAPVPKILVQANILDSLLNQQGIVEVPQAALAVICFLLSLATIIALFRVRPTRLISLTVFLLGSTTLASLVLFQPIPVIGGIWLPLSAPFLSLTLSFYLMIPLRLFSEHRKRFALERENRMLIQVEEMKSNFIQLVTHDLKTPVAKIQGLTEQLRRSMADRILPKDHELIEHLLGANQELNRFISSLLELTQLDHQGVRVQLRSKDINSLLEQMAENHHFSAQTKGIRIETDLEPMFPIRIDVDLIAKVLSNLIDNAIKYSPEGTTVRISCREEGSLVKITVADEGIGIPENEIQNVFSRFYRVKNDTTIRVKGTGLGLYLSRYFIEAHQGSIEVNSTVGQGTRFVITLPSDLSEPSVTAKETTHA